jgi:hypothetical protein
MRHNAALDKLIRGGGVSASASGEAAPFALAGVTATVTDPTGDTDPPGEPRADLTAASLSFGEGGPNVTATVPGGTDPAVDPNWDNNVTFVGWAIDTNHDAADIEYIIEAYNDPEFIGVVFTIDGDVACLANAEYLAAQTTYAVSFDPRCIGNPGGARFAAVFGYDTTGTGADVTFDYAPNAGLSAAARNDFATAKPAAVRGATWYLRNTLSGGLADFTFGYGRSTDFPLMCDWDGDGLKTPGVVRGNTWYLRNSNSGGVGNLAFGYGRSTDFPICGDWDGDGDDTVGVVRGNTWYLRNSNSGGVANLAFRYGRSTDWPIVGDWNGDGTTTPGVRRGNVWYLRNSNSGGTANLAFGYGRSTDFPVVGDWNGDPNRTETVGVVRDRTWYLRNTNTTGSANISFTYGPTGSLPLVWR